MVLKGVLIDFGNTLAYVDEGENRRYDEGLLSIVKRYGYRRTLDDLTSLLYDAYRKSTKGEVKDFEAFWEKFLEDLGIQGKPALKGELENFRKSHVTKIFKLYDGVIPVLSALKGKYKLALVSNCAIGLSDVIRALDLTPFFECIILSYEVGVRKPDKRIYLEALKGIKLEPHNCAFVSDEISDLEGARELGLKTILVRQGSRTFHGAGDPDFQPDYQCNHISEITKFIQDC